MTDSPRLSPTQDRALAEMGQNHDNRAACISGWRCDTVGALVGAGLLSVEHYGYCGKRMTAESWHAAYNPRLDNGGARIFRLTALAEAYLASRGTPMAALKREGPPPAGGLQHEPWGPRLTCPRSYPASLPPVNPSVEPPMPYLAPSGTPLIPVPGAAMFACVEGDELMHTPLDMDGMPDMENYGSIEYRQCDKGQVTLAWAALEAAGQVLPTSLVKGLLAAGVDRPGVQP